MTRNLRDLELLGYELYFLPFIGIKTLNPSSLRRQGSRVKISHDFNNTAYL